MWRPSLLPNCSTHACRPPERPPLAALVGFPLIDSYPSIRLPERLRSHCVGRGGRGGSVVFPNCVKQSPYSRFISCIPDFVHDAADFIEASLTANFRISRHPRPGKRKHLPFCETSVSTILPRVREDSICQYGLVIVNANCAAEAPSGRRVDPEHANEYSEEPNSSISRRRTLRFSHPSCDRAVHYFRFRNAQEVNE